MGVEGFKSFLYRNFVFKTAFSKKLPEEISSLFIDCNGIFYKAASKVYLTSEKNGQFIHPPSDRKKLMKKSKKNLEKLHLKAITDELEKHINAVMPKDNLIIAVDGVVNVAKMGQQKRRRFLNATFEEDPYQIFNKASITPGTEFMRKVDKYIENWLENYTGYLPTNTVYSSHLKPGEGEHKIFDYIRTEKIIKGKGYHVINGLDNDLIILSVVSPLKNMIMRPEDGSDPLNVEILKEKIISLMKYDGAEEETVIRDFSVVVMLLGNDFLHKFPNVFHSVMKTMPLLLKVYRWAKKPLTDKENNIIWGNYLKFLRTYDTYKRTTEPLYVQVFLNPPKVPYKEIEESIIVKDEYGNKVNQVYNPDIHSLSFNYSKFSLDWYKKQFNKNVVQWNGDVVDTFDVKMVYEMCINYLKMVQWVQYYYTKGYNYVSNTYFYHYIYNPLMGDVTNVLGKLIAKGKEKILEDVKRKASEIKITPIHLLLSVIPEKSIEVIPKEYSLLYKKYLKDVNPSDFEILEESYNKEHQRLVNLPQVNINYIDRVLKENGFVLPEYLQDKEDIIITKEHDDLTIHINED
jgi:5'-3' exonuclease